ncbi:MAG: hypothetical protein GIS02_03505 [Methanosarcinales archaeon]|uniref:Uncharacterized protein n=1 Tax=Candidatus Ethanoperedens thermophilum TaxID=2766897 RepID=A0A848D9A7_9EURY|nr:hypothetical protein [Candidatus Ethanoperedens thermophilum]
MTRIELSEKFKNQIKKIKDEAVMDKIKKEFKALLKDPTLGKPLRYSLKGLEIDANWKVQIDLCDPWGCGKSVFI